jgi:hypothetical protein
MFRGKLNAIPGNEESGPTTYELSSIWHIMQTMILAYLQIRYAWGITDRLDLD